MVALIVEKANKVTPRPKLHEIFFTSVYFNVLKLLQIPQKNDA